MNRRLLLALVVLMVMASGCLKRQTMYDMPGSPESGYYEIDWIEPQIVLSDSIFTLIKSDRIDSSFVNQMPGSNDSRMPSFVFHVLTANCPTVINLLDDQTRLIRPVLVQQLPYGHYKISFNLKRLDPLYQSPSGLYFVQLTYCDFKVTEQLAVH